MAAARPALLPLALVALALVGTLCATGAFVNGGVRSSSATSLRASAARRALPAGASELLEGTSVATSLATSTPGYWANIVLLTVPLTFLIILYLQSERTKAQEGI